MSSSNRTTAKGGKGSKADNKSHKTDKSDSGKGSDKQQTGRDAGKSEDPSIKDKVRQLIEMSQRSEEEVCLALHECDNDMNLAINMLLENMGHGEWETRVKKKKNRQASASKQDGKGTTGGGVGGGNNNDTAAADDDWGIEDGASQQTGGGGGGGKSGGGGGGPRDGDKDKSRNNKGGGGPPRLHGRHNDSRGWRGREKQENERNLEDGGGGGGGSRSDYRDRGDRDRRGRSGGGGLGGGSSSRGGGRGGRGGGRTGGGRYPPRGNRSGGGGGSGGGYNKPIDTWDNSNNTWDNNTVAATNHTESWDDFPGPDEWTTEEYTGSLTETKVFTPSVQAALDVQAVELSPVVGVGAGGGSVPPQQQQQAPIDNAVINAGQQMRQQVTPNLPSQSPAGQLAGGTLDAAQTQYLTQLTQQNSDNIKQYGSAQTFHAQNSTPQVYGSSAPVPGATQTYGGSQQQQQYGTTQNAYVNTSYSSVTNAYPAEQPTQPVRTKTQRARVPPPSKIPSSAVEMPGDLNSSIGYLDVQFGAMDFMSDGGSFDGVVSGDVGGGKYGSQVVDNSTVATSGIDLSSSGGNQGASPLDAYSPKNTQNSISSLSQSLTSTDNSIPQTNDLTGGYNTAAAPRTTGSSATPSSVTPSGLDLNKQGDSHSYGQQSTYNSYQNKANTYNSSTYSATQQTTSSYVSNQANNSSYVNSQATPYNTAAANTYQNAYSSAASYQSNANAAAGFPSISQANNSYHQQAASNNAAASPYQQQNSTQSVYGGSGGASNTGSSGLNNSSANFVGNANATSQYNSYSSSASGSSHKLVTGGGGGTGKDSTYDNSANVANVSSNAAQNTAAQASSNSNVTSSTSALSLSQATVSVTKSTTTLAAKNSSSVVSNIPPGVAPVMSTPYIMGQVPYFQPPVYSYEEVQMLQQRLPHMTTPYYDMSYQTPTTLAAVRDASLGNVGYSMSSDGRFTRGDNNASPVPSTLSQQTSTLTQGHQAQPILAGTAPPYFFTAAFNTLAPNYQFGTMYTQMPAATNAHGSSNSTQYPKPGTYGSGYGSYDALSQTQDYNKTGYNVGNNQGQKGAGVNATSSGSSGNDLSAMYGKSHAALGKVNSYDKQGFHSGTPPPFTGALHGGQNAGLAPSGTGYAPQVYIPTMNPHQQQLSTQLMHQPLHQDSGNSSGQRSQASNQAKGGAKQPYQNSYWNQA